MEIPLSDFPTDVVNAARHWLSRRKADNFSDWAGLDSWIKSNPIHIRAYKLVIQEDERERVASHQPPVRLSGEDNVIPFPLRVKERSAETKDKKGGLPLLFLAGPALAHTLEIASQNALLVI
jgi:hypothetical protein